MGTVFGLTSHETMTTGGNWVAVGGDMVAVGGGLVGGTDVSIGVFGTEVGDGNRLRVAVGKGVCVSVGVDVGVCVLVRRGVWEG
jgi:hypothetical protein